MRSEMRRRLDPLADDKGFLEDRQQRRVDPPERHVLEALDLLVPADRLLLDGMEAEIDVLMYAVEVGGLHLVVVGDPVAFEAAHRLRPS